MARLPIPAGPDDLTTPEWLTAALREPDVLRGGRVAEVEWERVGAEYGVTGLLVRAHLRYKDASNEGPRSLIAKLPMAETAQMSGYRAVQERDPARMDRYYERAAREVRSTVRSAPRLRRRCITENRTTRGVASCCCSRT